MKKSLVVVAHGSRRAESNQELIVIAEKLSALSVLSDLSDSGDSRFNEVRYGFLELAEPSIPEAIIQCIKDGADSVTVLPYFLSAGRHVTLDIPNEVLRVQKLYPDCPVTITPYLGASEGVLEVISKIALTTLEQNSNLYE